MRKVLIIGGGGLCGQVIAKKHIKEGDEVHIYDNQSNPFNDYSNLVGTDVSFTSIDVLFKHVNYDIISTQFAHVGVGQSQYEIKKYIQNNVGFMSELLQAILDSKNFRGKIIHADSMGAYGEGERECPVHGSVFIKELRNTIEVPCPVCGLKTKMLPTKESAPEFCKSYYAITKKAQSDMLELFSTLYNIPVISLRYFSVYGLESNPQNPYTGVLSVIGNKLINSDVVEINEDGFQTRDLICVDDIADAHYAASQSIIDNFIALNIGTGTSTSLIEVIQQMEVELNIWNQDIVPNYKVRKGDIRDMCASTEKTANFLNWRSNIDIYDGIEKYCQFLKKNWDKFKKGDTNKIADLELINRNLI